MYIWVHVLYLYEYMYINYVSMTLQGSPGELSG